MAVGVAALLCGKRRHLEYGDPLLLPAAMQTEWLLPEITLARAPLLAHQPAPASTVAATEEAACRGIDLSLTPVPHPWHGREQSRKEGWKPSGELKRRSLSFREHTSLTISWSRRMTMPSPSSLPFPSHTCFHHPTSDTRMKPTLPLHRVHPAHCR